MATQLKTETLIVLGVALAVVYMAYKVKDAVTNTASDAWTAAVDASKYVNPTSDQNLAYQGASSLARWLTGQETGDLGTIAWDYVHKAEPAPGGNGALTNYTQQQQDADYAAMKQLEAGFHGM
jgi:hypothetical protein